MNITRFKADQYYWPIVVPILYALQLFGPFSNDQTYNAQWLKTLGKSEKNLDRVNNMSPKFNNEVTWFLKALRKDENYKLLLEIFQKYFALHEQSTVKNSFSTYVCYSLDGLFRLNL